MQISWFFSYSPKIVFRFLCLIFNSPASGFWVLRTQPINIFSFKTLTTLPESSSLLSCTCCWFPKLYFQVEISTLNMSKIHLMSMFCLPRLPPPNKSFRSSSWLAANCLFHVLLWIIECFLLIYPFLSQRSTKTICSNISSLFTFFRKAGNTLRKYNNTFLKGFSVFTSFHIISQ